jgi:dipeptidyl aminopeptidase/acylaminoacyl peptidase
MAFKVSAFGRSRYRAFSSGLLLALLGMAGLSAAAYHRARKSIQKPSASPSHQRPLQLEDFYRIESASSPAISPDGRYVVYVRTFIVEAENRRQNEIWLAATDGSAAPTRLTDPAISASSPRWSPDGTLLVFSSRGRRAATTRVTNADAGDDGIWFLRMDQAGAKPFQIPGVGGIPVFSPDNQLIAYTKRTPPSPPAARQYASDFERQIDARFKGRIYDWMDFRFDQRGYLPDPRDPASTPPEELYIMPRAGGNPTQITHLGVNVHSPAWSPDSRALVFVANSHQRDEYSYERADLWVSTLGGETRRLTDDGYNYSLPCWSPDGRSLAFRREQNLNKVIESKQNHGEPIDVYVMPASGGKMENLTANWDLLPGEPMWSHDGRNVFFGGGTGGNTHLFQAPAKGGAVEQVTKGERVLSGFSFSASSNLMAYSSTDATHPTEIFYAAADGTNERRLSHLNDELLNSLSLAGAERINYRSKDGTMVEGWVMLPAGYAASRGGYPLILSMHGGPHAAYGNDFQYQFQLWAAAGYVVLYTNPRGSTGYGEKFLWGTWGGWGAVDFNDVMAGVDYVVAHYSIDQKRMGVTGYSYGGFLTNWIITHTSRFAAAITGAGISNWVSDYGTADIPRTKESEFYGAPWEAKSRELLRELSPITHVGSATTPTMFVHGESDMRVPIEQGEQMYTALKKRRVPARFIRYSESYHGGWTPWNTLHRYYQELKWWEQYLSARSTSPAQ